MPVTHSQHTDTGRSLSHMIVGLSGDGLGLLVRVRTMPKDGFWHVHSNEMTPYQRRAHRKLGGTV